MSDRRLKDADVEPWLEITLAVDLAVKSPKKLGVADLATPLAWWALAHLFRSPDGTLSYVKLRDDLRFAKNTMTRVTGRLKKAGYVVGGYDAKTGGVLLKITPDGRSAYGEILSHATSVLNDRLPSKGS